MFFRNAFYTIIIVTLFFGGLELVLALFGVRPVLLSEDPLVGFAENVPLFVEVTRADGSVALETAPNQRRLFNYQEFPRDKSAQSYRIFCMGGSTTHGRPYYDPVSFCGWLRAYLNTADPGRNWEVINAGGVSFASYRVAKLMNEFKEYQPDLFIVYSGQNEFLEERSYGELMKLPDWLINLNATLSATRTYTAMMHLIDAVQSGPLGNVQQRSTLSGEVDEILTHTIGPQSYHRDDVLKQQIMTHFRLNMTRMARIARDTEADIIFIQPAINIKDMSPFKSEHRHGLSEQQLKEWTSLYDGAIAQQEAGEFNKALTLYRQALEIDDRYADLHYRTGQVLFELKRYDEAEKAFRQAVEEDIAPLRILNPMQRIIEQVASQEDVPLIDYPSIIRKAYRGKYQHTVFGEEYFRDHVHTNMDGYRLLALAIFDKMVTQGIVTPATSWTDKSRKQVEQEVIANLDPRIEGRASLMLGKVLDWAGKHAEAYRSFKRAFEIVGPNPMLYDRLARSSFLGGNPDQAVLHLREALERYPGMPGAHENLALILEFKGKIDEAIGHCWAELEVDPTNDSVHARLASLLEKKGDDESALEHYQLAIAFKPDHEYARVKLVYLLIRQGRYDEALTHARETVRSHPEQHRAHHALGLILKEQGHTEEANLHFSQASRLKPGYTVDDRLLNPTLTGSGTVGKAPAGFGQKLNILP